ncbi:MAG TPA: nucleoside hydrolase [Candidatus Binatia bacterium]|nr:nucleoside hydrolase [Candidatus Binatia bacterium]
MNSPSTVHNIVLDCDPGHDDALAILLAARRSNVVAITTVHGNAPLERTKENARAVAELAGLQDIPIAAGADRPLVREPRYAPEVHGITGLDGPDMPAPTVPLVREHAVDVILDRSRAVPNLHLVAVGPLTNVALALQRDPGLAGRIERITIMGGSLLWGNVTAAAEFNIYCDPEAADLVFEAGVPITMVGLNVTEQVIATKERREQVRSIDARVATAAADMLDFYGGGEDQYSGLGGGAMHDPLAVAALVEPSIVETVPMHVALVTQDGPALGMTLCDGRHFDPVAMRPARRRRDQAKANADVAVGVDAERFWELFLEVLATYR